MMQSSEGGVEHAPALGEKNKWNNKDECSLQHARYALQVVSGSDPQPLIGQLPYFSSQVRSKFVAWLGDGGGRR